MAVKPLRSIDDHEAAGDDEDEEVFNDCRTTINDDCLLMAENSVLKSMPDVEPIEEVRRQPLSFLMSSLTSLGPKSHSRSLSSSSSSSLASNHSHSSSLSSSLVCAQPKKLKLSAHQQLSGSSQKSKFNTLRRKILRRGEGSGASNVTKKTATSSSSSFIRKKKKKFNQQTRSSLMNNSTSVSNFTTTPANSLSTLSCKKMKFLLAGDPNCGKSAILANFLNRMVQPEYRPTIVDDYEGTLKTLVFFLQARQSNRFLLLLRKKS